MSQPWGPPQGVRPGPPPGPSPWPSPRPSPWPPQGQWGPPYGHYGPPRRRNPLPWVLGVLAIVVIAAVVVVIVVTSDSEEDAPAADRSTVRGTAEAVLDGYMSRDADQVSDGFCEPLPARSRGYIEDNPQAPTLIITDITESTTTAEVEVDAGPEGNSTMNLRLDGDQWCVTTFRY